MQEKVRGTCELKETGIHLLLEVEEEKKNVQESLNSRCACLGSDFSKINTRPAINNPSHVKMLTLTCRLDEIGYLNLRNK